MKHSELVPAINIIRPGAKWTLRGDDYAGLDWLDEVQPKPTEQDIQDGLSLVQAQAYRDLRKNEYPPIGDQLDAIFKGGEDLNDMKVIINSVKAKYPKP